MTSETKSLMKLLQSILHDSSMWCRTSTIRDWKTITERVKHEGLSFLTITLPSYCADFERSLDLGYVPDDAFLSFRKSGALPRLFGGLLQGVFDASSGRLLDCPCHTKIYFIRQITLMFKKIKLPCTENRVRKAYDKYIECEREVEEWESSVSDQLLADYGRISAILWGADLSFIDRKVYEGDLVPRHGPGATADRLKGNSKYDCVYWTERLDEYFPAERFLLPNAGFFRHLEDVNFAEPGDEMPVRVITVPKTLKTPRIIAIEPTAMQYAQQSLMEVLVDRLERSDILSGSIGFSDQVPNQDLARAGSVNGSLATIDLSEASDRVSNLLVKRMLANFPHLSGAVQACRSLRADVPGHGIISLSKYASMGSATCFPIEAMVFLTTVLCGYERWLGRTLRTEDLAILRRVRVYGDDIIVPVEFVHHVVESMNDYGFVVNRRKSFWTGKFRESCGADYYAGSDVRVTYVRNLIPQQRDNVSEMLSLVSLRNQLYFAGFWGTVKDLDATIERLAPFPVVSTTSPIHGRHSFLPAIGKKMCDRLHRPLVKGMIERASPPKSQISGLGALLKFFIKRGSDPILDPKHLERYGRPNSVDIKIGWGPIQ